MAVAKLDYKYKTIIVHRRTYSGYEVSSTDLSATEINIPNEHNDDKGLLPVISIADDGCIKLKNVTSISIGKNIKYIGVNAFDRFSQLQNVYYNAEYASVRENKDGETDYNRSPFTDSGQSSGGYTLTIGKDVRTIPRYMFKSYNYGKGGEVPTHIKKIKFEEGVTTIEEGAFLGCLKNNTVHLPNTIKEEIASGTFETSTALIYNKKRTIKIPSTASGNMDFLAFSFNGKHSWDDFGIYRVGDGDRYNENLSPTMTDKTAEVPGGDGMYFFGTNHKQKDFNINFAFDHLTDAQIREMKKWLNGKEMGDLWFEESPYKVWTAKVTSQPSIKYIPFDEFDEYDNPIRIYKGKGSIVFTAYWPYAHTPEAVWTLDCEAKDGKFLSAYADFYNKGQWAVASGLTNIAETGIGENPGILPAPFVMKAPETIAASTSPELIFKVGELEIKVQAATATKQDGGSYIYTYHKNIEWNSKTGMISAEVDGKRVAIPYTGNSLGAIPAGGILSTDISINGGTLNYHYWYY